MPTFRYSVVSVLQHTMTGNGKLHIRTTLPLVKPPTQNVLYPAKKKALLVDQSSHMPANHSAARHDDNGRSGGPTGPR